VSVFRVIGFILRFYPLVMVGINVVETVMSTRPGVEKKAVLVNALVSIAGSFGIKVDEPRRRILSEAIDLIVAVFNATGWFSQVEESVAEVVAEVEVAAVQAEVAAAVARTDRLEELEAALTR
jgi:hypothetical protein